MGKIGFKVSVDDNGVPDDIRKAIKRGIRKSTKKLAKRLKEEAEAEIRRKDATDSYGIWEGDLIGSFKTKSDADTARVWNDDEAAGPMEHGVKPGAFGSRGPPIDSLLPWVREHFPTTTQFDPWEIGGGENFVAPGEFDGHGAHDKATSGTGKRFSLPEGDWTQPSSGAISGQSAGSGGVTKRTVDDIKIGESFYAKQGRLWLYGTVDTLLETGGFEDGLNRRYTNDDFVDFAPDGLVPDSPDLSDLEDGDTVVWKFGDEIIESVVTDPNPDAVYVEVEHEGLPHFVQRELVVDWESKELPSFIKDSWFKIDEDAPWGLDLVFYDQEVTLWDVNNAEYIRAYVREFNPRNVQVEFADHDGGTRVHFTNQREYRLVAGERWGDLTRSEQIQTLESYWDDRITRRATLDADRLDFVKNHLFSTMFPRFKDTVMLKQTLHLLGEIGAASQPSSGGFRMGSIKPRNNGVWNLDILKKQDYDDEQNRRMQILTQRGMTDQELLDKHLLGPYEDTITHEFSHAVAHSHGYELGSESYNLPSKTDAGITKVQWADDGTELSGGPVSHARHMMFHRDGETGPVIGFSRWNQYAYNNALDLLLPGMDDPGWETNEAGTLDRLIETVNRAWWEQSIWAQDEFWNKGQKPPEKHERFLERSYSTYYAHETLATFNQMMMAENPDLYAYIERLEELDRRYPWLIEEWLKNFEPQGDVADKLRQLGYNV